MWFFSRLARSAYGTSHHLDWAAHGFRFLCDSIWDRRHGGFHWELREGRVSDDQKHLYGQAFGLLALVEFARASGETEARELAGELFDLLERHAHDDPFGGYLESLTGDWRVGTNTDTVNRSMRTFP